MKYNMLIGVLMLICDSGLLGSYSASTLPVASMVRDDLDDHIRNRMHSMVEQRRAGIQESAFLQQGRLAGVVEQEMNIAIDVAQRALIDVVIAYHKKELLQYSQELQQPATTYQLFSISRALIKADCYEDSFVMNPYRGLNSYNHEQIELYNKAAELHRIYNCGTDTKQGFKIVDKLSKYAEKCNFLCSFCVCCLCSCLMIPCCTKVPSCMVHEERTNELKTVIDNLLIAIERNNREMYPISTEARIVH